MDVGNPSNFARLMDLYGNELAAISQDIAGFAFTDRETTDIMRKVAGELNYVLVPHGAIGYLGLKKYFETFDSDVNGIFLETAHPAKFKSVVEEAIGREIPLPEKLKRFISGTKQTIPVTREFSDFRRTLLEALKA